MENEVCLRFWHGGLFKDNRQGHMCYIGGQGRTFSIDADELCWWYLRDLVKNCGGYREINCMYYLNPGKSLTEGLCKVYNDEEVRKMAEVVCKYRCVDLSVKHGEDINDLGVTQSIETSPAQKGPLSPCVTNERPKKLTPKRPPLCPTRKSPRFKQPDDYDSQKQSTHEVSAVVVPPSTHEIPLSINQINSTPETTLPTHDNHNCNAKTPHITTLICSETPIATDTITTSVPEDYELEGNRPGSPIPWQDLLGPDHSSDYDTNSDPDFIPSIQKEGEIESGSEGETVQDEGVDTSDEEYNNVRDKVRGFNNNIFEVAQKLQRDAQEGKLAAQNLSDPRSIECHIVEQQTSSYESDYNESEEDVDTPHNSAKDEALKLDKRFASRGDFKQAVAKVGIFQGRDLGISISDKKRQQRFGVQCLKGCPFRIYASRDTRTSSFVVKRAILNGVASVFPLAEHRHCARHVFAVLDKTYRGDEMKIRFWKIVKSYNMADYTETLEELKEVDHQAAIAFQSYNPKHHVTTAQPSRLGKGGRVVGGSGRGASGRGYADRGSGRDDVGMGGSGRGSGRGYVRGSGDA
ncbi:Mediator of DNA damage checkpoint protein 1 [Bienertia sinuspersici]